MFVKQENRKTIQEQAEENLGMSITSFISRLNGERGLEMTEIKGWSVIGDKMLAIEDGSIEATTGAPAREEPSNCLEVTQTEMLPGDEEIASSAVKNEKGLCEMLGEILPAPEEDYPAEADTTHIYRHNVDLTIHWGHKTDPTRLGCKKKISTKHSLLDDMPLHAWPLCEDCFRGQNS